MEVRTKATLNHPTDHLKTLGATLGGQDHRLADFQKRLRIMQAMHHKLATVNDPAVELKLAKHCLGESKVQHLLRMYGSELTSALLNADQTIDSTLTRIATGITDAGRQQAALGLHIGGLGLRRLKDIAAPAELAAKLTARPKIREICQALTSISISISRSIS
ncbi:MAG: hypothetical protein ACKPKO_15760, partial [Candidatus Fonsibacter sp.]